MVKVLVCGGGSGAHAMVALFSSKHDVKVNLLTLKENRTDKWSCAVQENHIDNSSAWVQAFLLCYRQTTVHNT